CHWLGNGRESRLAGSQRRSSALLTLRIRSIESRFARIGEPARMKAIVIHQFGPPDVLRYEDVPDPQPRAGEIRISVHAATVNRVLDVSLRAGKEMFRGPKLPLIPGVDCAGVVDAVGEGVTRLKVGARVAAAGVMPLDICTEDGMDHAGPSGMMGIKRPGGF